MKVLLTGPFGNVGSSALEELLKRGHDVRCFDVKTKKNEKTAKGYAGQIEVLWGDIRRPEDVAKAVQGRDVILHLCFIIPSTMSRTGKSCEDDPTWAREINVGGTENLIKAAKALRQPPKLIFSSTVSVFGFTHDQPYPLRASAPVCPTDHYTNHKVMCENMVKESSLKWVILRFASVLAVDVGMNPDMFDVPLGLRIEFVHTKDVGLACANAVTCDEAVGKILLIGGGTNCQLYYRGMISRALESLGVGMLPDKAFSTKPFYMDWYDTSESQQLLQYQTRGYNDWLNDIRAEMGFKRHLARVFRPVARWYLLRKSPYYKSKQMGGVSCTALP